MKKRPVSITIISWFLIITTIMSAVVAVISAGSPDVVRMMALSMLPASIQYLLAGMGFLVTMLSGVLMLKGKVQGRTLYVAWMVLSVFIGVVTSPARLMLVPGLVVFLICLVFLFGPGAREYFASTETPVDA